MSTNQIMGTITGAYYGFQYGGVYGMIAGAAIGLVVGSVVDNSMPTPDIPAMGQPDTQDLIVSTCEEGLIISDLVGQTQLGGNIIWSGGDRTVEVTQTEETPGGKGGGDTETRTYVTGYKYYLSWILGICMGPVDTLYAVYNGDDLVWEGELDRPVDASAGSEITIEGMGTMVFYWGTSDQQPNSYVGTYTGEWNPAYRGLCYAFMNDVLIGEWNRAPTMKFIVGKRPTFDFSANETISLHDYNPAHAIYYIMNTMAGIPTSMIDDTTFGDVADTLVEEGFGIDILFNSSQTARSWVESVLGHVDGIITYKE